MYDYNMDLILTKFKRIKAYDGIVYDNYYINDYGAIINCNRKTMEVMKPKINPWGYYSISLRTNDGMRREYLLHKLVAKTFIINPRGNKKQVNHIDGNKLNNDVNNLEWCTQFENTQHAFDNGLIKNVIKSYSLYFENDYINSFYKKKDLIKYLCIKTGYSYDHVRKCISNPHRISPKSKLFNYTFVLLDDESQTTIREEYIRGENPCLEVRDT